MSVHPHWVCFSDRGIKAVGRHLVILTRIWYIRLEQMIALHGMAQHDIDLVLNV